MTDGQKPGASNPELEALLAKEPPADAHERAKNLRAMLKEATPPDFVIGPAGYSDDELRAIANGDRWAEAAMSERQKQARVLAHRNRGKPVDDYQLDFVDVHAPMKRVRWLWPRVLAVGKETLITGMPKIGKSHLAEDIIARVTAGAPFPGEPASATRPPGVVFYIQNEDDPADTVLPRLSALGANLDNLRIIRGMRGTIAGRRAFDLGSDLAKLESHLAHEAHRGDGAPKPALVVVSPITAYLGKNSDSNSVSQVRATLDPIADLLQRYRVAGLYIGHPKKAASNEHVLYHNLGSVGFVAAVRIVIYCMRKPVVDEAADSRQRYFLLAGSNVGRDDPFGFEYRVEETIVRDVPIADEDGVVEQGDLEISRCIWGAAANLDPNVVIAEMAKARDLGEDKALLATEVILGALVKGEVSGAQLDRIREDAQIGKSTWCAARGRLQRAGIIAQSGGGRDIVWRMGSGIPF